MKTLSSSLSALLLAATVSSAQELAPLDFPNKLDIPKFELKQAAPPPTVDAVQNTLVAMNDGNEVGTRVVEFIQSAGVKIEFRKQEQNSVLETNPKAAPVIVLREGLPLYPRVLASYITREAVKLMFEGMVGSAEKEYMKLSMTVRVWLELGGSPRTLPEIEPLNKYKDADLAASFKIWLDGPGSEMALHRIGEKTGTEIIPDMEYKVEAEIAARKPGDPTRSMLEKLLAGLEEDNKRFVDFRMDEDMWQQANGYRLRK